MVRKAVLKDVKRIYELTEYFARKGDMLHRPVTEIYSGLRDFFVYERKGRICGVCALHIWWEDLGEVRSLAIQEKTAGRGVGTELVRACLDEARELGLKRAFALTCKPAFFEKLDFKPVDKDVLPRKIWGDCVKCIKFPNCDEKAVIMEL